MVLDDEEGNVTNNKSGRVRWKDDVDRNDDIRDDDDETGFLMAHPYGVLPNGNAMMMQSYDDTTTTNSKDACVWFGMLTNTTTPTATTTTNSSMESIWFNHILSYCDGKCLCQLVQCCRYLYVLGHVPTLWRDLVLQQKKNQVLTNVSSSGWKDTWMNLHLSSSSSNTTQQQQQKIRHVPMSIPNMYSDYLFRLHTCGNFAIPSQWYKQPTANDNNNKKNSVPRIPYNNKNEANKRILQQYEDENRPVVLTDIPSWKNLSDKWQTYILKNKNSNVSSSSSSNPYEKELNEIPLRATSGATSHSASFTLAGYQSYCEEKASGREEASLYLFDREALLGKCPRMSQDILDCQSELMEPFESCQYHDLFRHLGKKRRPDHTWLIAGPERSGSLFHVDPNATHAWNACISGQKRWIFYSPNILPPPGVHPSSDGEDVCMPISLGEWFQNFYHTEHQRRLIQHPHDVLECTVVPGDVIFVPHGWWHAVINIGTSMNMAVTHNYVSYSNLPTVLRFLQTKQKLISGCRDRPQEAVQPEHLYDECTKLWQQPNILPTNLYQQAHLKSKQGWTNKAWKDDDDNDNDNNTNDKDHRTQCQKKRKHTSSEQRINRAIKHPSYNASNSSSSIMSRAKSTQLSSNGEEEKKDDTTPVISSSIFQFSFL